MSIVSELEHLAGGLATQSAGAAPVPFPAIAEKIAKNLGVRPDEVAILALSTRWRHLHFLAPEALKNVGFIPLTSTSAIAARTARDSRPEINNKFASVRHVSVFEGVKVGTETAEAIQKLISAPILSGDKVIGVIQVSRKGPDPASVGPDFTPDDLGKVLAVCKPLAKLLQLAAQE